MKLILLLLFSPLVFAQRQKSTNPNDEPFLPIFPEYPYNPKLMKRGIEQYQNQPQLPQQQPAQHQQQLSGPPELYAPKANAQDSYANAYAQNLPPRDPFFNNFDPFSKQGSPNSPLTSLFPGSSPFNSNPFNLLSSFSNPYPQPPSNYPSSPSYPPVSPNFFYQQPPPYFYPNYYNGPPGYPPPPPGYRGHKHPYDEDDDEYEGEKRREKGKKGQHNKNKLRHADRELAENQYVDGANYVITNSKDLDTESSNNKNPNSYNQVEDSDSQGRSLPSIPKTVFRLISIKGDHQDYPPSGYIKVQQLEQIMKQALQKLLAQNAIQQANLAQISQGVQSQKTESQDQYVAIPSNVAKTGLNFVVSPSILNRVNSVNPSQYSLSQFVQTQAFSPKSPKYTDTTGYQPPKQATTVTLQQAPGIYIPPSIKTSSSQNDYGDYNDSPDTATIRNLQTVGVSYSTQNAVTAQPTPTRSYFSTYRPTQTNLEDVNYGNKQSKSKA